MLDAGFVAVKVDFVKNPSVAKKYAVKNLPTDLIISPEGKILSRNEGYDEGGQPKYLANLSRINTQHAAEAKRMARANVAAENTTSAKPVAVGVPSGPVRRPSERIWSP